MCIRDRVILCDPIWHLSSRSSEAFANCYTRLLYFTLLTTILWWIKIIKVLWVMIDLYHIFRFVKGRCHGNQIMLGEVMNVDWCTCILCTSVRKRIGIFENELEYHYLYVHINSSDDQATAEINLVAFWPVPPEFKRINCVAYNKRLSALGFVYLRSSGGNLVMFRYYLLEGDTAAPSRLYAGLCLHF